ENQLCFPLYAAARKVTSAYTPLLKPLGITYTQYIVLMVLWDQKEVTVGKLGERLYLDNGTLTPLLKKLEQEGYVIRTRSKEDERSVIVSLTEKGSALKEKCASIPSSVGSCIPLNTQEAVTLYALLYKVLNKIQDEDPE
ncbi:MAG: MarR family transcriptional regulator, partial [Erysipelotrichales bacterium]|nr:MarR family transcriptional regulator [Erysipelotrichales bacterium]